MTDFKFNCTLCNKPLKASQNVTGQSIQCPACHGTFTATRPVDPPVEHLSPPVPPATTKACPFCSEQILIQAKKCKHCGEFLDGTQRPTASPRQKLMPQIRPLDTRAPQPEKTEYESHPAMFRSNPIGFILTLLLCLVGIGLLVFLLWWLDNMGKTLTVTSKRTILRKGILSKYTSEVYHKDVRNLQIAQSFLQRLFDVGTIGISSAAQSGIEIIAQGMPEPGRVKQIIDKYRNA